MYLPFLLIFGKIQESTFAGSMIDYLLHDNLPTDDVKARNIMLQADQYYAHGGLLYHIWHSPAKRHMPEYVPVTCMIHRSAHFGFQRTYSRIRQRYFWKGMYSDIDNWVRSCMSCS